MPNRDKREEKPVKGHAAHAVAHTSEQNLDLSPDRVPDRTLDRDFEQTPELSFTQPELQRQPGQQQKIDIGGFQARIRLEQAQPVIPDQLDRIRAFGDPAVNALVDQGIRERLALYAAAPEQIDRRIAELGREWNIERVMAVKSSGLAMLGLVFGLIRSRKWLLLPLLLLPCQFQQSLQGTSPITVLLRRMGFRTCQEIETEKYALKMLRGDFGDLDLHGDTAVETVLGAIRV
ncbi:MAG: hypothetical protein ACAI44_22620 [Candidatus Sericytochromatia bacterium]